jgi:hypothetical protein
LCVTRGGKEVAEVEETKEVEEAEEKKEARAAGRWPHEKMAGAGPVRS